MKKHSVLWLALVLALTLALPALADDYFVDSDDFQEGEEVINVFLHEPEYRIMIESIERNSKEFDWGWTLTPGWAPSSDADAPPEGKKRRKRRSGPKTEQEPKSFAFSWSDYRTIRIPEVANHAGIVRDEEIEAIRKLMATVAEQLGLEPQMSASAATDLEISAAVVDLDRQGGGFGFIQVQPFIEIEVRIRDLKNDRDLVLIRNQEHAGTPEDAATEMFSDMIQFLR